MVKLVKPLAALAALLRVRSAAGAGLREEPLPDAEEPSSSLSAVAGAPLAAGRVRSSAGAPADADPRAEPPPSLRGLAAIEGPPEAADAAADAATDVVDFPRRSLKKSFWSPAEEGPSGYAAAVASAGDAGQSVAAAPAAECVGWPGPGLPPGTSPPYSQPEAYASLIQAAVCASDDGAYDGYACTHPDNAGKKCQVFCRTTGGTTPGDWTLMTVMVSSVAGEIVEESCDDPSVCENPEFLCSGAFGHGLSNCDSTDPRPVAKECSGSKADTTSWTFSAEVSLTIGASIKAGIPFCKGKKSVELSVTAGGSRTGSTTWTRNIPCPVHMAVPGCHYCSPDGGQCLYTCRVTEVEKVYNANIHFRVSLIFNARVIGEDHTCTKSQGNVQIVSNEWIQAKGCVTITNITSKCDGSRPEFAKTGECAANTTTTTSTTTSSTTTNTTTTSSTTTSAATTSSTTTSSSSSSPPPPTPPTPPNPNPNPMPEEPDPGAHDDPHFATLKGERYDYHGQCDLIYTTCPSFDNNKGLRIHIRTKHVEPQNWSTITNLAVKIGKDEFELQSDGTYRINSEVNPAISDTTNLAGHGMKLQTYDHHHPWWQTGGSFKDGNKFSIALDNGLSLDVTQFSKTLKTNEIRKSLAFKFSGVHEHRDNGGTSLLDCVGLSSTWDHPEGDRFLVGRSGTTYPRTDNPSFGKEWQVDFTKGDPMLFAEDIGQQLPDQSCVDGVKDIKRRQLEGTPEGDAVVRQAEDACRHLKGGNTHTFEACVYDVIVTGDVSFAEDPWYNDEF